MKFIPELREACAVNAAVLGAAFLSGREAATFFAVTGRASWLGIAAAAVLFGAMMGMLCHFSKSTGASTLPGIYYAKLDERCGDSISIVHGLLMLMTGAVALTTAGELGMLSLNCKHPTLTASAVTMLVSMMLTLRSMKPLSAIGAVCLPICTLFFIALAADSRPVHAGAYIQNDMLDVSGNVPVALFMGLLFACLKAASVGGVAAARAKNLVPIRFGICCGGILATVAGCANLAMQKAGPEIWALNLPTVVLAARWGLFGYYAAIYVMWLGSVCVLSCALGSVSALVSAHLSRPAACIMTAAAVSLMSVTGLRPLVTTGYPMLGWICALCLAALSLFYEGKKRRKTASLPIT